MVNFQNMDYDRFLSKYGSKKIVLFGAYGSVPWTFLAAHAGKVMLMNRIEAVLDNDEKKQGQTIDISSRYFEVLSVDSFLKHIGNLKEYIVIILVREKNVMHIVNQLDAVPEFDGVVCIYGETAASWSKECYPPYPADAALPRAICEYKIPKNIHYCWFGENAMSQMERRCIESWKTHCPDYDIRFWNEENYDIAGAPMYVKQAYSAKKYAFVSDYVRLDVVYKYGGVYFDTDVELLQNIDRLLEFKAFFGFESFNLVGTGLGYGSVPKNSVLKDLMDLYSGVKFTYDDGTLNTAPCPEYHTEYFRSKGIRINNSLQLIDDMLFLPSDYLCPFNQRSMLYEFTDNTISNHHFSISWFDSEKRKDWHDEIKGFEIINDRLKCDWLRSL